MNDLFKAYREHGLTRVNNCQMAYKVESDTYTFYSYYTCILIAQRVYNDKGTSDFKLFYNGVNTYSRTTTTHFGKALGILISGIPSYFSPMQLVNLEYNASCRIGGTRFIRAGVINHG